MSQIPRVTVESDLFTVLDDVLAIEHRDALWNYFQLQPFQRVDALGMQGQWLLEDSGVLRGPTTGWEQRWDAQYPTQTPLDAVMRTVADAAPHFAAVVGARGEAWRAFSACPMLYTAGQGRLWHRDADDDVGSCGFTMPIRSGTSNGAASCSSPTRAALLRTWAFFCTACAPWPITRTRRPGRATSTTRTPTGCSWRRASARSWPRGRIGSWCSRARRRGRWPRCVHPPAATFTPA